MRLLRQTLFLFATLSALVSATSAASYEDLIVYTANQEWLSRIYLLRLDGSVYDYQEFEFYRWCDVEIIDNELYAAEAYAPRVYRIDIETWELELVVDDWTLYYFYDLAFDGEHLYVEEWDYNRYLLDGTKVGAASYDGTVYGSAWNGEYLWNVGEDGVAHCWDVSGWPDMIELAENVITLPSTACRGLWFDGEHFWTAEATDGALGYIYKFDQQGQVVEQWREPAYIGWAAGLIEADYRCGDCDDNGSINIADAVVLVAYIFAGGTPPTPLEVGDVNCDTLIDVSDVVYLVSYIFAGGPPPCATCG